MSGRTTTYEICPSEIGSSESIQLLSQRVDVSLSSRAQRGKGLAIICGVTT